MAITVTIGGSIALIVIGAILRFGLTWKPVHVNLQVIGVIFMIPGAVGLVITIAIIATRRRGRPAAAKISSGSRPSRPGGRNGVASRPPIRAP